MEDISRQVARLEKELEFWRNLHREELQKDLGEGFLIGLLGNDRSHHLLRDYLFPIEYHEKLFGIILPFREQKKVLFASPSNKSVYESASKVFRDRGYDIKILPHQLIRGNEWCLTVDEDVFNHAGEL